MRKAQMGRLGAGPATPAHEAACSSGGSFGEAGTAPLTAGSQDRDHSHWGPLPGNSRCPYLFLQRIHMPGRREEYTLTADTPKSQGLPWNLLPFEAVTFCAHACCAVTPRLTLEKRSSRRDGTVLLTSTTPRLLLSQTKICVQGDSYALGADGFWFRTWHRPS